MRLHQILIEELVLAGKKKIECQVAKFNKNVKGLHRQQAFSSH